MQWQQNHLPSADAGFIAGSWLRILNLHAKRRNLNPKASTIPHASLSSNPGCVMAEMAMAQALFTGDSDALLGSSSQLPKSTVRGVGFRKLAQPGCEHL